MKRNPSPGSRTRITVATGLALAGLLLAVTSPASAGNLDVALLEQKTGAAETVLIKLHKLGYENVGVLPFHVTRGPKEKSGYDVAPIALNLTTRLENALILSQDPKSKVLVGIIRDAAGTAPPDGLKAYQSEKCSADDYEELFLEQYNLGWGDKKVKADAFLTGRVINPAKTPDSPYVKVTIELIDAKSRDKDGKVKRQFVQELCVTRDRALLADLGISFAVPREKLASFLRGRAPASEDREGLIGAYGGWGKGKPKATPEDVGGMAFSLYYGVKKGDKVEKQVQPVKLNAEGVFEAPAPPVGATVTLALKHLNKDDRTRAVVLKMNGRSLWKMEEQESQLCQKWLFDAGKSDTFEGYYFDLSGDNMKRFVVEPVEKARGKDVGPKLGWIEVDVFAEAEPDLVEKKDEKKDEKKEDKDKEALVAASKVVSLRSAGAPVPSDGKALKAAPLHTRPLAEVQEVLQRENNVVVTPMFFPRPEGKGRGTTVITVAGSAKPGGDVKQEKPLRNPQPIGSLAIKYYYGK